MKRYRKIGYLADRSRKAQTIAKILDKNYINILKDNNTTIDLLIVLGGDGFMLHSLRKYHQFPIYGINCGTLGFLMNNCDLTNLEASIDNAKSTILYPLKMTACDIHDNLYSAIAFNEVSVLRKTHQAVHIRVIINDKICINPLVSDGILLSSPAGSSAYNFSAGGQILPIHSNVLSLTALNSFRPRRWKGALISNKDVVKLEILDASTRSASTAADYLDFQDIKTITIHQDHKTHAKLLFNPNHLLEDRLMNEQFS